MKIISCSYPDPFPMKRVLLYFAQNMPFSSWNFCWNFKLQSYFLAATTWWTNRQTLTHKHTHPHYQKNKCFLIISFILKPYVISCSFLLKWICLFQHVINTQYLNIYLFTGIPRADIRQRTQLVTTRANQRRKTRRYVFVSTGIWTQYSSFRALLILTAKLIIYLYEIVFTLFTFRNLVKSKGN